MTTDYRALCARMADALDHYRQLLMDDRRETHALAAEARAALAQPGPVGPTDEELKAVYWEAFKNSAACGGSWLAGLRAVARFARTAPAPSEPEQPVSERRPVWTEGICGDGAAILKDGVMQPIEDVIAALNATSLAKPEPEGLTDEEPTDQEIEEWADAAAEVPLEEMDPEVHGWRRCFKSDEFSETIRAALRRFARPAIEPVPVGERPWEREGWCDAEGRCWMVNELLEWAFRKQYKSLDSYYFHGYTHLLPHWALPLPTPNDPQPSPPCQTSLPH
jgi:hypothetical protein